MHWSRSFGLNLVFGCALAMGSLGSASAQDAPGVAEPAPAPPGTAQSGEVAPAPATSPTVVYVAPPSAPYAQPAYGSPYAHRPRLHRVPYEEGMPIPEGGQVIQRNRPGLWIPGLAIFLGTYGLTALTGSAIAESYDGTRTERERAARYLYIPVIGPFLFIPHAGPGGETLLVFDGLLQAGGIAMFVAGLTLQRKFLVYMAEGPRGRSFAIRPTAAPGGMGLGITF